METPAVYDASIIEKVAIMGDLKPLTPTERVRYYQEVCHSLGLNPLTKPFDYIVLKDGNDEKLVLYAKRDCTDQLRALRQVSVVLTDCRTLDDVYIVTAKATMPDGRTDTATGVVSVAKEDGEWKTAQSGKRYFAGNGIWQRLRGDALANAMMKAETKAKRRVTLSIVGLGWLDETEIETIRDARPVAVDTETGEIAPAQPVAALAQPVVFDTAPGDWLDLLEQAKSRGIEGAPKPDFAHPGQVAGAMAYLRKRIADWDQQAAANRRPTSAGQQEMEV